MSTRPVNEHRREFLRAYSLLRHVIRNYSWFGRDCHGRINTLDLIDNSRYYFSGFIDRGTQLVAIAVYVATTEVDPLIDKRVQRSIRFGID